jgi:hypothetical protein
MCRTNFRSDGEQCRHQSSIQVNTPHRRCRDKLITRENPHVLAVQRTDTVRREALWKDRHVMPVNRTLRSAGAAVGMFVVVGALWAVVGYVYTHHVASALLWGGVVTAAGSAAVAVALCTKYIRLRRRRGTSDRQEPS